MSCLQFCKLRFEFFIEFLGLFLGDPNSICIYLGLLRQLVDLFLLLLVVFEYFISLLLNLLDMQFQLLLDADVLTDVGF